MKNKKKKTINKEDKEVIILGIILVTFIFAVIFYWIGFHNMDYGNGIGRISLMYDISIMELNSRGEMWSLEEVYMTGLRQQTTASFIMTFTFIGLFMMYVGKLIKKKEVKK